MPVQPLVGNGGSDTLIGGGTSAALVGEYDYIDGGDGADFVSYNNETNAVTINLGLSYDSSTSSDHDFNDSDDKVSLYQNAGAAERIQIVNVENLEGGSGDDTLYGNSSNNTLIGLAGTDTFRGGAGADVFVGGVATYTSGVLTANTDSQIDTVDYSNLSGGIGISADFNEVSSETILNTGKVTNDGRVS